MKMTLEIKNLSGVTKPKKDNIIIYDGKEWYVTTKEALFGEYEKRVSKILDTVLKELSATKEENKKFKVQIASQMKDMSKVIEMLCAKK